MPSGAAPGRTLARLPLAPRTPRVLAVAECPVGLRAHPLAALIHVLDVEVPEAARAELGLLGRAHAAQHLPGAQAVAETHRLAERDRVVADHGLGQVEDPLQVEV